MSARLLLTIAAFLVILFAVWVASMPLHEVWHGVAAEALGGNVVWVRVRPGIEVWPTFGRMAADPWGTGFMAMGFTTGENWGVDSWQDHVVGLMGSVGNLLVAALALGALWLFRPRGWFRLALMAQALMFLDLLLYCTLPEFFGLPHYVVLGGNFSEPLRAAEKLGCPRWAFLLLVGLASALMAWGLVAYARRRPDRFARPVRLAWCVLLALLMAACVSLPAAPVATPPAAAAVEAAILQAAWDAAHTRYPLQPWPDDIYIVHEHVALIVAPELRRAHVVLCSSATGFLWEGDVLWRAGCDGDCIVVEGVRERYVVPGAPFSVVENTRGAP